MEMPVVELDFEKRDLSYVSPLFTYQADESYRKTEVEGGKEGTGRKGKGNSRKLDRRSESAGTGSPAGSDFVVRVEVFLPGWFPLPTHAIKGGLDPRMYIFRRRTCHSIISLSARNADEEQVFV